MANSNSNIITDLDASPSRKVKVGKLGGRIRCAVDSFEVLGADIDADGDTVKLCRLPSNAIPLSVVMHYDALGTNSAFNVGLYTTDGTLVDEDAFASAETTSAAGGTTANLLAEAGAVPVAMIGKELWEWAGAAADPGGHYDIVLTQTATVTDADGTVGFVIQYAID